MLWLLTLFLTPSHYAIFVDIIWDFTYMTTMTFLLILHFFPFRNSFLLWHYHNESVVILFRLDSALLVCSPLSSSFLTQLQNWILPFALTLQFICKYFFQEMSRWLSDHFWDYHSFVTPWRGYNLFYSKIYIIDTFLQFCKGKLCSQFYFN
jgi:hypothetical protein